MIKSDEIALLVELAERLGPDSYCGPWLKEQIPWIERDIRSDLPPSASWEGSRRLAYEIQSRAESEAQAILDRAHKDAEENARKIENDVALRRSFAISGLKRALEGIQGY